MAGSFQLMCLKATMHFSVALLHHLLAPDSGQLAHAAEACVMLCFTNHFAGDQPGLLL